MPIDDTDRKALRNCALICWQKREELALKPAEVDEVLVAWMAVGTDGEGEAASTLLAARKDAEQKQANFDRILSA